MSYNGIEIDMLSLGNADSILVTKWTNGTPERVLVDGGNKNDAETVLNFLSNLNVDHIDHLVCTHSHDDHAGGLPEIVASGKIDIGLAWMHLPGNHTNVQDAHEHLLRKRMYDRAEMVRKSLETNITLSTLLRRRGVNIIEPFLNHDIGFLTVCSPSLEYYEALLKQFYNPEEAIGKSIDEEEADFLLDNPETSPENNSSVILAMINEDKIFLFTADAGVPALSNADRDYDLKNCWWMQIPHHGSRRNISSSLIKHFKPGIAYISAKGDGKHPRRAVVNAYKEEGALVFSTHYPRSRNMWYPFGNIPPRFGYTPLIPLYEAED